MISIISSKQFEKSFRKLVKNDINLEKQVIKSLQLLSSNPSYPSLRLHKLSGKNFYSISVNMSIRIIVLLEENRGFLLDIGTHDQVY